MSRPKNTGAIASRRKIGISPSDSNISIFFARPPSLGLEYVRSSKIREGAAAGPAGASMGPNRKWYERISRSAGPEAGGAVGSAPSPAPAAASVPPKTAAPEAARKARRLTPVSGVPGSGDTCASLDNVLSAPSQVDVQRGEHRERTTSVVRDQDGVLAAISRRRARPGAGNGPKRTRRRARPSPPRSRRAAARTRSA